MDLVRLVDWFAACGVKTVAMESIGVYWIAVFELLDARCFEVFLVNAPMPSKCRGARQMSTKRNSCNGFIHTAC